MELETKHFGSIEIEDEKIISFPDGIPGFEENNRFILLQNPDEEIPFHWLQSTAHPELAFVVANPFLIRVDYDFQLPETAVNKLAIDQREDVQVFCIVRVPENMQEMTINLVAPLVINTQTRLGKQVVLEDGRYHTRHLVADELAESNRLLQAANEEAAKEASAQPENDPETAPNLTVVKGGE